MTSRLRLRTWSPDYDLARPGDDDTPQDASVTVDVEVPARSWEPMQPRRLAERSVIFIDGVQRLDAWADVAGEQNSAAEESEAIFGSFAAGAVRCSQQAEVLELTPATRRCFCRVEPGELPGRGPFAYQWAKVEGTETSLEDALNRAMNDLEVHVATRVALGGELVVVDGPLRQRDHLPDVVGFIKTHRATYLTDPHLAGVVARLAPGQRTPVFRLATRWERYSWYTRLPVVGDGARPSSVWRGVVRGEAGAHLEAEEAIDLADRMTATVVKFASSPVKDARAPQNLVPVGSLERLLRHRLGDRELLLRSLRSS